jgi:hypothetical protein
MSTSLRRRDSSDSFSWRAMNDIRCRVRTIVRNARCAPARRFNERHASDYDFRRSLVISGMRRGGTTWLAELIAGIHDTTLVWEPLNIVDPRKARDLRWAVDARQIPNGANWWIPFIPQSADDPEARQYFHRLFTGQLLHSSMFQLTSEVPTSPTRHYLFKFCRANRLLPWMVKTFAMRPPVFLVRHPCAVVASMMRHRPAAHLTAPFVVVPDRYSAEFHQPYLSYLASLETREEIFAALWCLDHSVPLNHPWNDQRWITLSYECLVKHGRDAFRGLCQRLELPETAGIEARLKRPSRTTVDGSPILEGGDQLSGWRKHLSRAQIDRVLAVVAHFGLDDVYSDELEPDYDRLAAAGGRSALDARLHAPERAA